MDNKRNEAKEPRLLDTVRSKMRLRHMSLFTEKTYILWIKQYTFFHNKRHPKEMSAPEIVQFLSYLAVERKVTAATQNQAFHAILFLYQQVLEVELPVAKSLH